MVHTASARFTVTTGIPQGQECTVTDRTVAVLLAAALTLLIALVAAAAAAYLARRDHANYPQAITRAAAAFATALSLATAFIATWTALVR
jgi:ABC-type sulfate transport system permease component